jgi:hypothetical protein
LACFLASKALEENIPLAAYERPKHHTANHKQETLFACNVYLTVGEKTLTI